MKVIVHISCGCAMYKVGDIHFVAPQKLDHEGILVIQALWTTLSPADTLTFSITPWAETITTRSSSSKWAKSKQPQNHVKFRGGSMVCFGSYETDEKQPNKALWVTISLLNMTKSEECVVYGSSIKGSKTLERYLLHHYRVSCPVMATLRTHIIVMPISLKTNLLLRRRVHQGFSLCILFKMTFLLLKINRKHEDQFPSDGHFRKEMTLISAGFDKKLR